MNTAEDIARRLLGAHGYEPEGTFGEAVLQLTTEAVAAGAVMAGGLPVAPSNEAVYAPVTSWTEAAEVLGISRWTLARLRREKEVAMRPWWATPDDCREWYLRLTSPAPKPKKRGKKKAPPKTGKAVRFADEV